MFLWIFVKCISIGDTHPIYAFSSTDICNSYNGQPYKITAYPYASCNNIYMDFTLVDIPEAINGKDGKDCNETRINELETKIKDLEDKIAYLNDKIERYLSIIYINW
jgi:hypothetical protein